MKISPADIRNPRNPAQAQAVDRSKAIMEDVRLLSEDLVSLDNHAGVDRNDQAGKVVISQTNLLDFTHRQSRTSIQPPGSHGKGQGYPTDPVYRAEERANATLNFDPASGKVDSMHIEGSRYTYDSHHSQGLLGFGEDRQVFSVETGGVNGSSRTEKVSLFADGTLDYNLSDFR